MFKKNKIIKIILLILFIITCILVFTGKTTNIDNHVYIYLRHFRCHFLDNYFKFFTSFGDAKTIILVLCILNILLLRKDANNIDFITIICILSNTILKNIFRRERPAVLKLIKQGGFSFPSGHSMIAVCLYGYLFYYVYNNIKNKLLKFILESVIIWIIINICISRVYLGVHYFSDIIGGFILGLFELICLIDLFGGEKNVQNVNK